MMTNNMMTNNIMTNNYNFQEVLCDISKLLLFKLKISHNKPSDFKIGDRVVVLHSIDFFDTTPIGSIGIIENIMHRYKHTPNEHYEYWVYVGNHKTRYEIDNIVNMDRAFNIMNKI